MRLHKILSIGFALGIAMPLQASAYFTPEDVLLSKEFFLPPSSREAQDRIERQVDESAERRQREQDLLLVRTPSADELDASDLLSEVLDEGESLRAAAPELQILGGLDASDLELLKSVRLLEQRQDRLLNRVDANQQYLQYYGSRPEFLHGGAPPLAPTGAGGALSAVTMLGAVFWTIRRARRAEQMTKSLV